MMKRNVLAIFCLAAFAAASVAHAQVLYDNGLPDGVNGYSNATVDAFGARRTLLDDFTIPDGESWSITDFHWRHLWTNSGGPFGTGAEISFYADAGGTPDVAGGAIATATNIIYGEENLTVNQGEPQLFSRDVNESSAEFDSIPLGPGTYWFEATVIGPENNFWLTSPLTDNECWVNYDDLGGLQSGTTIFGAPSDINFVITGQLGGGGECAAPTSYQVFRGIEIGDVDVSDFADQDEAVACYNPGFVLNNSEAPVWLVFQTNLAGATEIQVDSFAGTPSIGVRAECRDWSAKGVVYVQVGEQQDESFPALSSKTFGPIPDNCIDKQGNVEVRVGWRKKGFTINFPWKITVDRVNTCN